MRPVAIAVIGFVVMLSGLQSAHAQSPANVAVVINDNSAVSQLIGEYYAKKRAIPTANVIHIRTASDETINRTTYTTTIENPIASALAKALLQDQVLYLVLTKGVPLRIEGTAGLEGTMASVDSELALLYRKSTGQRVAVTGPVANPYFLGDGDIAKARRFSHREQDIYLVTRLDGFTPDEVMALIDTGAAPARDGRIVLDERAALVNGIPDQWLAKAADQLASLGHGDRVVLESTPKPAAETGAVIGYYSWGATDPQLRTRRLGVTFAPGALAATFAGPDGRTFLPPPVDWAPMSSPRDRKTWFAGSPQSLIGDLIRAGATGVAGNVAEPLLQGVVRPNVLFSAYLSGFSLVESFYLAMPFLSWQGVIVGDPLCNPFAERLLTGAEIDPPVDRRTELPGFYSARRLNAAMAGLRVDERVASLVIHAEIMLQRGDTPAARKSLLEVTAAAPTLVAPHLQLALLDEQAKDYDTAATRYRRVLQLEANNAVALNNLAYYMAERQGMPAEAKPLAEKAVELTRRAANAVDTLGWVEYLLGNRAAAGALLEEAVRRGPNNAEIRVHAAIVAAALGNIKQAAAHLDEARRRDPSVDEREDVIELRKKLPVVQSP